jgi:hypothetical protein
VFRADSTSASDGGVGEAAVGGLQELLDGSALCWVAPQQAEHSRLEDSQRPQQLPGRLPVLPGGQRVPKDHVHRLQHLRLQKIKHSMMVLCDNDADYCGDSAVWLEGFTKAPCTNARAPLRCVKDSSRRACKSHSGFACMGNAMRARLHWPCCAHTFIGVEIQGLHMLWQ